jgi:SAM-dependent methyltransferase
MDHFISANRESWATLAEDHYLHYRKILETNASTLNSTQIDELGDITGKSVIHLQCNTGADSISLARLGAKHVTGVDLVPENVEHARRMAADLDADNITFVESNVLEVKDNIQKKYDIVFTTEGVLCWLPDLNLWADNVRHLLADDGFLYVMDGHPFYMVWEEEKLPELVIRYPYFKKTADKEDTIGGYASDPKESTNYSWMYTVGDIINALSRAGLHIEWFHEFDWLYFNASPGKQIKDEQGNWMFPDHRGKLPYTFSLKATVR